MLEKRLVVFFASQLTDDGDVFAPRFDFGFAEVKDGETINDAAKRFIIEMQSTMNCGIDKGRDYELSLLAYTALTTITAADNPEGQKFLQKEREIEASLKDHVQNHTKN